MKVTIKSASKATAAGKSGTTKAATKVPSKASTSKESTATKAPATSKAAASKAPAASKSARPAPAPAAAPAAAVPASASVVVSSVVHGEDFGPYSPRQEADSAIACSPLLAEGAFTSPSAAEQWPAETPYAYPATGKSLAAISTFVPAPESRETAPSASNIEDDDDSTLPAAETPAAAAAAEALSFSRAMDAHERWTARDILESTEKKLYLVALGKLA